MTTEDISAPVAETPAAQPQDNVQLPVADETPEQDAPKPEQVEATDKEEQEASEAAKTLNERKAKKAERYRENERRRFEAERENASLKKRIEQLEAVQKPDPEKVTDIADYDVQQATYAAAQLRKQEMEFLAAEAREKIAEIRQAAYSEALSEFRQENPGFDPKVFISAANGGTYANELADALMDEPEVGLQIMAALVKTPDEIAKIAAMSPRAQLRALARIEANLSRPAQVKVTQAPAPVKAVTGAGAPAKIDPDKMSYKEFVKWRESGGSL